MNNAAMDICVQVLAWEYLSFLFGTYLGKDLLGYMVTLCLTFEGLVSYQFIPLKDVFLALIL